MSNGASLDQGPVQMSNEGNEPGPSNGSHADEPTPAGETNSPGDFSDVASVDSSSQKRARKHRRGGRKKNSSNNSNGGPAQRSESHLPWSERSGRLDTVTEWQDLPGNENERQERYENGAPARDKRPTKDASSSSASKQPFETGLRAFNLKRAESSGGGRPIGISVEGNGKSNGKSKKSKKKKKAKKESEDEDSSESEEEEKQKPLSIRLDLNLELEIFLRAKVKGDITITFMQ